MKKISLIFLTVVLFASPCIAGSVQDKLKAVIEKKNAAAGLTCTDGSGDSEIFASTDTTGNTSFGFTAWRALKFPLAATTRITAITVYLRDLATVDSCTVTASIYDDDSDEPGSEVAGTSVTVAEADIADGGASAEKLVLSAPVQVNAGNYYVMLRNNHGSETTTTRSHHATSGGAGVLGSADSGSTWTAVDADALPAIKIHGCQ